jgi:hypothetical protein
MTSQCERVAFLKTRPGARRHARLSPRGEYTENGRED